MSENNTTIAINGFGRIGRALTRLLVGHPQLTIRHINDPMPSEQAAYLLRYDSAHFRSQFGDIQPEENALVIGNQRITYSRKQSMARFNWADSEIDVVVNSSGKRNDRPSLERFLENGAKRVFVSAPAPDVADVHILRGVNDADLKPEHRIISGGSCTASCFAPIIKMLDETLTIERGYLQTIHAYTSSQNLTDGPHPSDPRRGRAAAANIVPTTTEAVRAFEAALSKYRGLLKGMAMRVPVVDGSNIDLVLQLAESPSREELNELIQAGANGAYRGIVEYTEDPIVSSDIVDNAHSCVFDSLLTEAHGPLVRLFLWYDNEWGYANRFAELLSLSAG